MSTESNEVAPLLRIVKGDPTPDELAAVVAVVAALRSAAAPTPTPTRSLWAAPRLRGALATGPGAWRASSLPR